MSRKTMSIRLGAVAGPWELAAKMGPTGGKSERADLPVAEDFKALKRKTASLSSKALWARRGDSRRTIA